jgi:hypothetical protein
MGTFEARLVCSGVTTANSVPIGYERTGFFRTGKWLGSSLPVGAQCMSSDDVAFRSARGKRVEKALRARAMSRVRLAELAGYDERTIRNLINGVPVRDQTVIDVCAVLQIQPEFELELGTGGVAEDPCGAYARAAFVDYEGAFTAYRRSFSSPGRLMRSIYLIAWDEAVPGLAFTEFHQLSRRSKVELGTVSGKVYVSSATDLVQLVSIDRGDVRVVSLLKMRGLDEIMVGAVLTHHESRLAFQPALSPIYLAKFPAERLEINKARSVGTIGPDDDKFEAASEELDRIERDVILRQ